MNIAIAPAKERPRTPPLIGIVAFLVLGLAACTTAQEGGTGSEQSSDLAAGLAAYDQGRYADALRLLADPVRDGNSDAEFVVGLMYWGVPGVPQNGPESLRLLQLSAAQGNLRAANATGYAYDHGIGTPSDPAEAVPWYRKAADGGERRATNNLGILYLNGSGVAKDPAQAAALFRRSADEGDMGALANLALLYAHGVGVQQDTEKAIELLKESIAGGNTSAATAIGNIYSAGNGVPKDMAQALRWYELAARAGDGVAMVDASSTEHVLHNDPMRLQWMQKAAATGLPQGELFYGAWLIAGANGAPKDPENGIALIRKAALQGDPVAAGMAGTFYANGMGVKVDFALAAKLLAFSSARGFPDASYWLGILYLKGRGVPQDRNEAVKLFRLAAQAGQPEAMNDLALLLTDGDAKDVSEGVAWLQRSAAYGTPSAMHNLARFYAKGQGVPRDLAQSYYWAMLALRFYPEGNPAAAWLSSHLKRTLEVNLPLSVKNSQARKVLEFVPQTPPATAIALESAEAGQTGTEENRTPFPQATDPPEDPPKASGSRPVDVWR